MTPSLSTLGRSLLAAAALSAVSTGAFASTYHSSFYDPFASGSSYTVDLQTAGHASIALPGLGVSATDFIINNFVVSAASHDSVPGAVWVYTADFQAFNNGVAVTGVLASTNFTVLVDGQHPGGPTTGTFTEHLLSATFSGGGVSTFLDPVAVAPSGTVTIAPNGLLGGYLITPPNLTINAQYTDPNGDTHSTPPLTDVNGTSAVPAPAPLALMLPGLLALRRRRAA